MESVCRLIKYIHSDFWLEYGDPRVVHMPLLDNGPWKVLSICTFYYIFARYWGPKLMKERKPFDLRVIMMIHNLLLIIINGIGFFTGFYFTNYGRSSWTCSRLNRSDTSFASRILIQLGYLYFISKFLDLFDTVFFLLRHKANHITTLHVFHHSIMPITSWIGIKFYPGGNSALTPLVNSFIHMIMYTYYLMTSFGPGMKKYLWWKKYLTQLQLMQFTIILIHSIYSLLLPSCDWPLIFAILEGLEAIIFILLFSNFYKNQYFLKNK